MAALHVIQRRYLAEELTRLRRADEQQRYAASQRRGRIDPNPHQIDAVVFALRRIPEGGCILADEVGLGKTIEAGLVIAQRMAEGSNRVLLIVPKPLLGQWRTQLYELFALETKEAKADPVSIAGTGVFLIGRELAGGERGSGLLRTAEPFDLVIIDEAHELFSTLYKRYRRDGSYDEESTEARMAHRVRSAIGKTPVVLLTATPIQNSLVELWALVQYVEPTGTLLGKLNTFREVFCDGDDRRLVPGQAHELKRRIGTVIKRTLRRQAQEFLETKFVERHASLREYSMSAEEKALYDDVSDYLLEPDLCAFQGGQRRLLLLGFHRRLASSIRALASSLANVAARLRRMLNNTPEPVPEPTAVAFTTDLEAEDDEPEFAPHAGETPAGAPTSRRPTRERIQAELSRVESFISRAETLPADSKADAVIDVVKGVLERGRRGEGSGKVVMFTESLTTQDYIAKLLEEQGGLSADDVTIFRGQNDSERAMTALARWREEAGSAIPAHSQPAPDVAVRLALVHEFKTRSKVFISTEAGGKGLNLQFSETLINYDLPWNPQRIEQRIGRCHRYGQKHDVTVFNFLAKDNEAQRLTFEILSQKLDLFGAVLDASDAVLHRPQPGSPESLASVVGMDVEAEFRRIHEIARSREERDRLLRELRDSTGAGRKAFDEMQERTSGLIETQLDGTVREVFRRYKQELPASLERLDRDLERLVSGFLDAQRIYFTRTEDKGRALLSAKANERLPAALRDGFTIAIGHSKGLEDAEPLHLTHPLVIAAIAEAQAATSAAASVTFRGRPGVRLPDGLTAGMRGRLVVTKVTHRGFEPVDRLLVTAILEGRNDPLDNERASALLGLVAVDAGQFVPPIAVSDDRLEAAVEEAKFVDQRDVTARDQERFERTLEQLERYIDDQAQVVRSELEEVAATTTRTTQRRNNVLVAEVRRRLEGELVRLEERHESLTARLASIESRQDPDFLRWREDAHTRRYRKPVAVRVLDVEFVLA